MPGSKNPLMHWAGELTTGKNSDGQESGSSQVSNGTDVEEGQGQGVAQSYKRGQ